MNGQSLYKPVLGREHSVPEKLLWLWGVGAFQTPYYKGDGVYHSLVGDAVQLYAS